MALPVGRPTSPSGVGRTDFDNPLVPYDTVRAQPALFDLQPATGPGDAGYEYDKQVDFEPAGDSDGSWDD